ncbi:MAG: YggS family pyridoxal phosphate-dependent enzyme [Bacteroidota bacterium]
MFQQLLEQLYPTQTTLVAVSKTKPNSAILNMYELGQRDFGENRVQELSQKYETLPKDIRWHAIGHLQTNKVKYIAPFVHLIHSVDSAKLLKEINKQALRASRKIACLLQFKIAEEDSKYGLLLEEAQQMLRDDYPNLEAVQIKGVMGMATFTDDEQQVRQEFRKLKRIFDRLKQEFFSDQAAFKEISMGMSGDYPIAIEEGSTMIRIGSLLFGARD